MRTHDGWQRIRIVAERELRERARSKAFRLGTLAAIIGMALVVILPSALENDTKTYRVGLAGTVAAGTTDALTAQAQVAERRVMATTYDSVTAGEHALRDRKLDVLLVDSSALVWRRQANATLATGC
jgi:ABC-2 type transport system permease protein